MVACGGDSQADFFGFLADTIAGEGGDQITCSPVAIVADTVVCLAEY